MIRIIPSLLGLMFAYWLIHIAVAVVKYGLLP